MPFPTGLPNPSKAVRLFIFQLTCMIFMRIYAGIDKLPGCNPLQYGPMRARKFDCGDPLGQDWLPRDQVTFLKGGIPGWEPVGCAAEEDGTTKVLNEVSVTPGGMSVEKCTSYCASAGYVYAGLKARNECSCGNSFDMGTINEKYSCNLICEGDKSGELPPSAHRMNYFVDRVFLEYCGAMTRVAVYKASSSR